MNKDLQKLVDYAIVDGYITDKERQILINKAQVQGFDIDELEMILEGRLNETSKSVRPAVDKCPNCGEPITGISKVCPACDYVLVETTFEDAESLTTGMRRLEDSLYALKSVPNPGASSVVNSVVLIICTGGLYILYKKLVKKEVLFDRYFAVNKNISGLIDRQVLSLNLSYGDDKRTKDHLVQISSERDAIIKKRQKTDAVLAIVTFLSICIIVYLFSLLAKMEPSKNIETAQEKAEQLVAVKNIEGAKRAVILMDEGPEKDNLFNEIQYLTADSLALSGRYDESLATLKVIREDVLQQSKRRRERKIDSVAGIQINELITQQNYDKAREQSRLISYPGSQDKVSEIDAAEAAYKKSLKKSTSTKSKRRRKK